MIQYQDSLRQFHGIDLDIYIASFTVFGMTAHDTVMEKQGRERWANLRELVWEGMLRT